MTTGIIIGVVWIVLSGIFGYFGWRDKKSSDFYYNTMVRRDDIRRLWEINEDLKKKYVLEDSDYLELKLQCVEDTKEYLVKRLHENIKVRNKRCGKKDTIVWSFKPFKLESWYTPEELDIINKSLYYTCTSLEDKKK
jgi:hypothetical protein